MAGGFDVELELSQTPYKANAKTGKYLSYIIGETEDEYLAVRVTSMLFSYEYMIARYDKSTMNLLEAKPMMPKDYIKKGGIKPTYSWGVNQYKDMIYLIFGYKDQSKDNITLYYQKLDADGSFDGAPDELIEAPFIKGKAGYFSGTFSYDSSKFLSVYDVPNKQKENEKYVFNVFNVVDHSLVQNKEVELPFMDKDVVLKEYTVDNDGNVFGLVSIYEKAEKGSKQKGNYTYRIYGFYKDSEEALEFDIDNNTSDDVFINSIILQIRNGIIYCTGFWGKKSSYNISGIYSIRLNSTDGKQIASDFYEFSDEFIEEFYTDKQVEKADKKGKELELIQMKLNEFIINPDGTAFVIGEQSYEYEVCVRTNAGTFCYWVYVRNDVIASKIDANGEILWATKIPKKSQYKNSEGYMSYYVHVKDNDLYFVYYDHVDNYDLTDPKKYDRVPVWGKKLDLICLKVDGNGEKEKKLMYNYADKTMNQLKCFPVQLIQMNSTEAIGSSTVKGDKEVLSRFNFR